jgi:hypothetical protein
LIGGTGVSFGLPGGYESIMLLAKAFSVDTANAHWRLYPCIAVQLQVNQWEEP